MGETGRCGVAGNTGMGVFMYGGGVKREML